MRPNRDESMMELAGVISKRSTCPRRQVGAVLVDKYGRVLSMGHNGVARGEPHCSEGHSCGGEFYSSGTGLEACHACHAEMNALIFCPDVERIDTLYVTTSPCDLCIRYLINTSCRRIVYREHYDERPIQRWKRAHREAVAM